MGLVYLAFVISDHLLFMHRNKKIIFLLHPLDFQSRCTSAFLEDLYRRANYKIK